MNIVILGKFGSGKSMIAKRISRKLNMDIIEIGDIVRDEYKNASQYILSEFAYSKMRENGYLYFIKKIGDLKKINNTIIVGPRTKVEYEYLKQLNNVIFISVICSDSVRFKRYKKIIAKNAIDPIKIRTRIEKEWDMDNVLLKSDYFINNNKFNFKKFEKFLKSLVRIEREKGENRSNCNSKKYQNH